MKQIFLVSICYLYLLGYEQRDIQEMIVPNMFFSPKELKLEMIFDSKVRINGKWYEQGDHIFYFIIKKINLQNIILEDSMKRKIILKIRN